MSLNVRPFSSVHVPHPTLFVFFSPSFPHAQRMPLPLRGCQSPLPFPLHPRALPPKGFPSFSCVSLCTVGDFLLFFLSFFLLFFQVPIFVLFFDGPFPILSCAPLRTLADGGQFVSLYLSSFFSIGISLTFSTGLTTLH